MNSPADLSIRRPVATAMLFLVIITIGLGSLRFLPIDLLPEIEFPQLAIRASYPNVGPEEIERLITEPLENAVAGLPRLEQVTSFSREGGAWLSLSFSRGTDMAEAANDLRDALEGVRNNLPEDAETPRVWKFNPDDAPIVTVAVSSNRHDLEALTRIIENDLARRFEQIDGVGTIDLEGIISRVIRVDLYRDRLQAFGITAREVQQAISRESAIAPGGNVKEGLRDLYVRAVADYETLEQIASAVIATRDGTPVRVRDVAEVRDDYDDVNRLAELDGIPVIQIRIRKQTGSNTVAVAAAIRNEVDLLNSERSDIALTVVADQSSYIQQSIDNVRKSALWGSLLAVIVLYVFLRNKASTGIIALSIPISLIATFGLLYFRDFSLNLMTFGGLALGVGMIVDNSIVVLENIVRQREEHARELRKAASVGAREVAGAIVASTMTTLVIFLPIVFMQTITAVMFRELAVVVIFSLLCSLLVALTLVPMLASRFLTVNPTSNRTRSSPSNRPPSRFKRLEDWYGTLITHALRLRYFVFAIVIIMIIGATLLFRVIPIELAPETDANEIDVRLRMDDGTNLAVIQPYLEELESLVRSVVPRDQVESISTQIWRGRGEIEITLPNPDERVIHSSELADTIRDAVSGKVPGAQVDVRAQSGLWILRRLFRGGGGEEVVQLQLLGHDPVEAVRAGRLIRARMERVPGVFDVQIGGEDDQGQPEQRIRLDRDRIAAIGLSIQEVAEALRLSLGGGRAGVFRTAGDEFPILVRLRPEDRLTTLDLENIAVRVPDGTTIPLSSVTFKERGRGATGIRRIDGQRVTYISANLETGIPLGSAIAAIREELRDLELPEGFSVVFGGEYEEQQRAQRDFTLAIVLALVLIYMVMAGQFERFVDPVIVMCAVPLVLVGVVPTLWVTGTTLNMQSLMGLIMLIGIVVNNAIILVDYINLLRREQGLDLIPAVTEAGRLRLRAILMTTTTTILGLFPLALGLGAGGEVQAALARTVIGGLGAATLITLILIPVVYVSAYQARSWLSTRLTQMKRA